MKSFSIFLVSVCLIGALTSTSTPPPAAPGTSISTTSRFTFTTALGLEPGVTRRDPSDVIKVGSTYYVWYTKVLESQEGYPSGYPGSIAWATSRDGHQWTEQGVCLTSTEGGAWDSHGVFTPNILVADAKYYLFYTAVPEPFDVPYTKGVTPTAIGIAVASRPEGPWRKYRGNPILKPEAHEPDYFDSFRVDDASLLVRDGKYWLYYKGRGQNKTTAQTQMGVAIAENPTGPYRKQKQYGGLHAGHEVMVWPENGGVASMATASGPRAIYFAPDGIHFELRETLDEHPVGPGLYRSDHFLNNTSLQLPYWGISHHVVVDKEKGFSPLYLQRFEYQSER